MKDDIIRKKRKQTVDDLNEELYYQKKRSNDRSRRQIHSQDIHLDQDFPGDDFDKGLQRRQKYRLPTSFYKKLFFGVLIFFVGTLIVAGLSLYEEETTHSDDLIAVEILSRPFIDGGEELDLQVRIQNFNEQTLEIPDLVLAYAEDGREGSERQVLRRSLDDLGEGDRVSEPFELTLFGQEGEVREIEAILEYRIDGSNAIFVKEAQHEVIIRSTPAAISLDAPDEVVRDQIFEFTIGVQSNSNEVVHNTVVDIEYPAGFEFISASPEPTVRNHVWDIPSLRDEPQSITVRGRLAAFEGEAQSLQIHFGRGDGRVTNNIETLFSTLLHTIEVDKPFLDALLIANNSTDEQVVIPGGGEISGTVRIENTEEEALQNVRVLVNLSGNLYTPNAIRVRSGFFDSANRRLVWDASTLDSLALIQPGERRELSFTLPTQELVAELGSVQQPEYDLAVDVEAVSSNGQAELASRIAEMKVVAQSDLAIEERVMYGEGPFENFGPLPPVVGRETTYTLELSVLNSSHDVERAQLRFRLPPYVSWRNVVGPSTERNSVQYSDVSREVVWNIGELPAATGFANRPARTVQMQLLLLPSDPQRGDQVTLTDDIVLTGLDTVTQDQLSFTLVPVENILEGSQEDGADGRIQ